MLYLDNLLKKISEFILFGSVFIAACAVALCIETSLLLHLKLNPLSFYIFVFGATLVQYNFHYLVKKKAVKHSLRLAWSLKNKTTHKALIAAGILLIFASLFSFRLHHFIILVVLGAVSCLYSFPILPFTKKKRLKDFGLLKIIILALFWTVVTVWFPLSEQNVSGIAFYLIFLRRFIFIFLLCLLFDVRDVEIDKEEKISTLPVIIGIRNSYIICYILLLIFIFLSVVYFFYFSEMWQLTVMIISAGITFFVVDFTKKNHSDLVYLACVDGMMFLQAVLVIFAHKFSH